MMKKEFPKCLFYFPGCSLVTTARECHFSVIKFCKLIGIELIELEDWNCCGTSSAHSLDLDLSYRLAWRILSLVPPKQPLLVVCPTCHLRLQLAHHRLNKPEAQEEYQKLFGIPYKGVEIISFLELVSRLDWKAIIQSKKPSLNGLKFAPYYGCMLSLPPALGYLSPPQEVMESVGKALGGVSIVWGYTNQCCGSYLSAVRPDVVSKMVDRIISEAKMFGAECIVTPCAMCQLNLEIRCQLKDPIPILHFSELLTLAFGMAEKDWFRSHFIDPRPLLRRYHLFET